MSLDDQCLVFWDSVVDIPPLQIEIFMLSQNSGHQLSSDVVLYQKNGYLNCCATKS